MYLKVSSPGSTAVQLLLCGDSYGFMVIPEKWSACLLANLRLEHFVAVVSTYILINL